jgi:23S rRNA pseudouridine1911/1915/1917 synthase
VKTKLVFEDDSIIVVEKPHGLLTMATERERVRTVYAELRSYVKQKRPPERLFIVHRLDREASGLLVFAKTAPAKDHLQTQFKDHTAGRRYIAIVEGHVEPDNFTIRSYLAENAAYRVYSTKKYGVGKLAVTHIRVLKQRTSTARLEIKLETGRKHQIRVHLAERGNPIVGDTIYGSRANPIRRLALHGTYLEFRHPRTGKAMRFESPLPREFESL